MDMLRWAGFTFCVRHDRVLGLKDLTINATCETEDKDSGGEKFVARKSGKPADVTLTALLNARLGVNVQQEALAMQDAARNGTTDYMYAATAKLFPCLLMLTGAKINKPSLTPAGAWRSCEVALTFKQASKWDGSTSASSGKKKKKKKKKGSGNGGDTGDKVDLSWEKVAAREAQKQGVAALKNAQAQSRALTTKTNSGLTGREKYTISNKKGG